MTGHRKRAEVRAEDRREYFVTGGEKDDCDSSLRQLDFLEVSQSWSALSVSRW